MICACFCACVHVCARVPLCVLDGWLPPSLRAYQHACTLLHVRPREWDFQVIEVYNAGPLQPATSFPGCTGLCIIMLIVRCPRDLVQDRVKWDRYAGCVLSLIHI